MATLPNPERPPTMTPVRTLPPAGLRRAGLVLCLTPLLPLGSAAGQKTTASEPVRLYYDELTTPHVFAETDEGALFGLGYQHMRDNPIGTLDRIWRWSGRFAEFVGPSYLDEDYAIRLWQVPEVAERHLATMPPDILRLLDAYVRGVERGRAWWRDGEPRASESTRLRKVLGTETDPDHVALHVDPLPDYLNQGFHPFQLDPDSSGVHPDYRPEDVPAYVRRVIDNLFDVGNRVTVRDLVRSGVTFSSGRELLYRGNEIVTVPNDPSSASNSWAISSTATGGPTVLHSDPHALRNNLRARYYLLQVQGDAYQVAGMGLPGVPVLIAGGNDSMAWGVTNSGENLAVTKTSWTAPLEDDLPLRFPFDRPRILLDAVAPAGLGFAAMPLTSERDVLRYFDPVASRDLDGNDAVDAYERVLVRQVRRRYYVPAQRALGVPRSRHPVTRTRGLVVDGRDVVPEPGDVIRFDQSAFTTSAHPYEFYLRLGRTRAVSGDPDGNDVETVVREHLWSFTSNFLFADHLDRFLYVYKSNVPIQGDRVANTVAPEDYRDIHDGKLLLDGTRAGLRWKGFYGYDDLPTIGPVTVHGPEVWISNNPTPDLVEVGADGSSEADDRFDVSDLAALPNEIQRPGSVAKWRQRFAKRLFSQEALTPGTLAGRSEVVATDLTDPWMSFQWAYLVEARDIRAAELGPGDPDLLSLPDVHRFVDWMETHRHLSEDGLTHDPTVDWQAHEYSLVTVYGTLLRSFYETELARQTNLTALQESFGEDPLHPLYDQGVASFRRPAYTPNIDAMWDAFLEVARLWRLGSGGQGLRNQALLVSGWASPAWVDDPRFSDRMTDVDPTFASWMQGSRVTRWGHVKQLILTPHLIPPGRAASFRNDEIRLRGHALMGVRPENLASLDPNRVHPVLSRLQFPVYEDQEVLALPFWGTRDTMMVTSNNLLFQGSRPHGEEAALYAWDTDDHYLFVPHEKGSQVVLSCELSNPPSLRLRALTALGGTELTRPVRAHQQRFAPSRAFAKREWTTVELDEEALRSSNAHRITLGFRPQD